MTDIARVRTVWGSFPGAPGVTTMYMDPTGMQAKVDAWRVFWDAIKNDIPTGTTLLVDSAGDTINDANGELSGSWSVTTPPASVSATGIGVYSGLSGAVIHWVTGAVRDGRRVIGRTFIVPLLSTNYESNGSLVSTFITRLTNAGNAFIASAGTGLMVWHRPLEDSPDPSKNHAGSAVGVTSCRVADRAVVMQSRRI